jgi:hypothetical protein
VNLFSAARTRAIVGAFMAVICTAVLVDGAATTATAASAGNDAHGVGQAAAGGFTSIADFRVSRLALTDGRASASLGQMSEVPPRVDAYLADDVFHVERPYRGMYAAADFQIEALGEPTGYWIEPMIGQDYAECAVFSGDPLDGGKRLAVAPFTCSAELTQDSATVKRFSFDVQMNRWSEASGKIATRNGVSLTGGTFSSDQKFQISGSKTIGLNSFTNFDAVLREGDWTRDEDQARTEFSYRVVVDGVVTPFWVAGVSANYRGAWFRPEARCGFYVGDPLKNEGRLDNATPIETSGLTCSATGSFVHGPGESGNGHYDAAFTVSRS